MKFKYISFEITHSIEDLKEDFKLCENPLPHNNLPDGEYMIRGNKKSHRTKYWVVNNNWFLVNSSTKDNGHFYCDANVYQLFPNKSQKEWENLKKIPFKCLSKYWQRALIGYINYQDCRKLRRGIIKDFLKFDKES